MARTFTRKRCNILFVCFLSNEPFCFRYAGQIAFVIDGFKSWEKKSKWKNQKCFSESYKDDSNSFNNITKKKKKLCKDLMNQSSYLQKVVENFTYE